MDCCTPIIILAIIIIAISNAAKKGSSNSSDNGATVNLDDIFNEVMKTSGQNARSSRSVSNSSPVNLLSTPSTPARRNTRPVAQPKPTRNVLTSPTVHNDHICEDVNYDNLGSLEGGTGSFNLGEPEPTVSYSQKPNISFGREDLLKSFIMSEVLQRYDINRIYSRIPSAKTEDE